MQTNTNTLKNSMSLPRNHTDGGSPADPQSLLFHGLFWNHSLAKTGRRKPEHLCRPLLVVRVNHSCHFDKKLEVQHFQWYQIKCYNRQDKHVAFTWNPWSRKVVLWGSSGSLYFNYFKMFLLFIPQWGSRVSKCEMEKQETRSKRWRVTCLFPGCSHFAKLAKKYTC